MFVNTTAGSGSVCAGAAINCQFSILNVEQSDFYITGWRLPNYW